MNEFFLTFLAVVFTLIPIILGVQSGNKKLLLKYNQGLSGVYLFWIVVKRSLLNLLYFCILIGLLSLIVKDNIWYYLVAIFYPIINFYYAQHKVIEEFDIMFKPGDGLLTPEGWAKADSRQYSAKTSLSSKSNLNTLIYSSPYGGALIGKIDNNGNVYTSGVGSSCIGHVDDGGNVYDSCNGGSVVARFHANGNVYSGAFGGDHLGKVKENGDIYNSGLLDAGTVVAKASGPKILAAGAAYLSLFR